MPKTPGLGEGHVAYLQIKVRYSHLDLMLELFTNLLGFVQVNQEETQKLDYYDLLSEDAKCLIKLQSASNYEQSTLKSSSLAIYASDPYLVAQTIQLWAQKNNLEFDALSFRNGEVNVTFPLVLGLNLTFIPGYM